MLNEKHIESEEEKNYNVIGIRYDRNLYKKGSVLPRSREMGPDGDGELLDGTCCLKCDDTSTKEIIRVVKKYAGYEYKYAYIIGGRSWDFGEDDGEIIVQNAVIIKDITAIIDNIFNNR